MKKILRTGGSLLSFIGARRRAALACPLILFAVVAGCKKKNSESNTTLPQTNAIATEVSHAPVYTAPTQAPAVATPAGEPDFSEMNRELRRWILRNRRAPKSFEEFAGSTNAQFPPPPTGKKYALDKTMHVILVKL